MIENALLTKLKAANDIILNGWLMIPSAFSAEVMTNAGWDSLTIDMQHGVIGYDDAVSLLTAISTRSTVPVVRVPWLEPGIIMKVLDAGAMAVICPMINNRTDAETLASICRYPPRGMRSFGPLRAQLYAGPDYAEYANDRIFVFAMIETYEALSNLDDILSVDGIDGVYVGPADLSLALGRKPAFDQEDEDVVTAIDLIAAKAMTHGVSLGIHNTSPAYALRMIEKGYRFLTVSSDVRLMTTMAKSTIGKMRDGLEARRVSAAPS